LYHRTVLAFLKLLGLRWPLFAVTVALFAWNLFSMSWSSLIAFLVCGALWYFLSQRQTLRLDSSKPR
jgi:hypothetical protein